MPRRFWQSQARPPTATSDWCRGSKRRHVLDDPVAAAPGEEEEDTRYVDPARPLVLRGESEDTRSTGFFRTDYSGANAPAPLLWSLLGFSVCVGNLSYPLVTAAFPAERSGRVNTALNLMVFVGAFGVQWGFGAVVDLAATHGADPVRSFRIAFAILLALQAASFAWFMLEGRRNRRRVE